MWFRSRRESKAQAKAKAELELARARVAKERAEKERELEDLLARAEDEDGYAEDEVIHFYVYRAYRSFNYGPVLERRINTTTRRIWVRREYKKVGDKVVWVFKQWQEADSVDQQIDTLTAMLSLYDQLEYPENLRRIYLEIRIGRRTMRKTLKRMIRAHYYDLLEQTEDSRQAILDLGLLIQRTQAKARVTIRAGSARYEEGSGIPIPALSYPWFWNELVARRFEAPPLKLFDLEREHGPGEVLIMAARALRTEDFTLAQIVLAYRNDKGYAVGGTTDQLAKLVEPHFAETAAQAAAEAEATANEEA